MQYLTDIIKITFKVKYKENLVQITLCEDNRAVGKIVATIHDGIATITKLNVDEYSRHNGYGTLLIKKLQNIAKHKYSKLLVTAKTTRTTELQVTIQLFVRCKFTLIESTSNQATLFYECT
jgi:N-acetylglutamate synthase-like GNAT family acetyltransferase